MLVPDPSMRTEPHYFGESEEEDMFEDIDEEIENDRDVMSAPSVVVLKGDSEEVPVDESPYSDEFEVIGSEELMLLPREAPRKVVPLRRVLPNVGDNSRATEPQKGTPSVAAVGKKEPKNSTQLVDREQHELEEEIIEDEVMWQG